MNKYIRNVGYKVPFEFCKECKEFTPYCSAMSCLNDRGCKSAINLYKKYTRRGKDVEREGEPHEPIRSN